MANCGRCGTDNEEQSKYCRECGFDLQMDQTAARLYGQEVDVLFFYEGDKLTGIVNPTLNEINHYRHQGVIQKILIGSATTGTDESAASVLPFIRKSKEFLGEEFDEAKYRAFSLPDLKKEYLKLFERVLKVKAQRHEIMKPDPNVKK